MKFRPPWAQRLMKRLAARHDLSHFEGVAWKVHNEGMGNWSISRTAANGDMVRFVPYTADNPNPQVFYYKKEKPADAAETTPES
jgi:hypothetical protein